MIRRLRAGGAIAVPSLRRPALLLAVGVLLTASGGFLTASAGAASGPARATTGPVTGTFVGRIAGTNRFIAVVATPPERAGSQSRRLLVWVCDGVSWSDWFRPPSFVSGNTLDLRLRSGASLHATLTHGLATGTVDLPGKANVPFTAARATGIAGLYSLNRSIGRVRGITFLVDRMGQSRRVSDAAVLLHATVARRASGRVSITGSTVALGPGHIRRAIHGSGHVFGSLTRRGNWIVLPDGRVSGVTTTATTMNAGGGNCSTWSSIKSLLYGVYCGFYM